MKVSVTLPIKLAFFSLQEKKLLFYQASIINLVEKGDPETSGGRAFKLENNEQCIVVSGLSSKESLAIQRMSIAANNQRNLRNCLLQIDKIYHHFCQCRMYRKNVYVFGIFGIQKIPPNYVPKVCTM